MQRFNKHWVFICRKIRHVTCISSDAIKGLSDLLGNSAKTLRNPSLLLAPKTGCDPVALLKCIVWPLNRNSSGLKGVGDKNKKVKGNRSPFSCKRGSPISQIGLEFKLLLSLSRWQGHGRDRRVSQGCSSTTRMSQVQGHKCIHSKSAVAKPKSDHFWPVFLKTSQFYILDFGQIFNFCWVLYSEARKMFNTKY